MAGKSACSGSIEKKGLCRDLFGDSEETLYYFDILRSVLDFNMLSTSCSS